MYRYLGQHPEIFMPVVKEPHFFGSDLLSSMHIRDKAAYRALFASRCNEPLVGEASVYYLYSRTAAHEIRAFNPHSSLRYRPPAPQAINPLVMLASATQQ